MDKGKNMSLWIEQGYALFAEEGLEGIQVERLSRILQRNKSGFYHYFADMEGYCAELVHLHENRITLFVTEIQFLKKIDPDYLLHMVRHATTVMFQVQLTRNKTDYSFYNASMEMDRKINLALRALWVDFTNIGNTDLAMRYYDTVRDMFYNKSGSKNFNYRFLHGLFKEAKELIDQAIRHKSHVEILK